MAEEATKRETVFHVFETISRSYDRANRRISLGLERGWKRRLIRRVLSRAEAGGAVLDVCCGTGDIALSLIRENKDIQVTGLDFSPAMLEVARERGGETTNLSWKEGDAMALPFPDDTFFAACISFGLRNTSDYAKVLEEMMRVVKPGGWVYCMDSFVPDSAVIRPFYQLYFHGIMPLLGGGGKYRREYLWLWKSTQDFLRKDEMSALFGQIGLRETNRQDFFFGVCALHEGRKPELAQENSLKPCRGH